MAAVALLLSSGLTYAQQDDRQDRVSDDQEIEEIVVSGTATGTGIRGVAPVGSQTLNISRVELLESPVRDAAEIITMLPQGSQIGSGVASPDGGNDAGNSGLNLRGLGGNASLLLLDGHRMASQGVSAIGPDPSAIPFAAIERVEVVLDGASSVYGSDAVAGVVNFIMRDDFEGADLQFSGRTGVYDSSKIELVAGDRWGKFSLMGGASYDDQGAMSSNERAYLMQDLRAYGGNDNRLANPTPGNPGVIEVDNTYYGVPESFVGTVDPMTGLVRPTLAEVQATPPTFADEGNYTYYTAETKRTGLFLRANYDFTDAVRLTYTGLWSKREAHNISFRRLTVNVTPDSPYYIAGLAAPGESYGVHVSQDENGFPRVAEPYVSTLNHYLDLRWDIGEWQMNGSAFYGRTHGADINRPERNNAALVNDPAGTPEGYRNYADYDNNPEWFNPYLTTPPLQPGFENLIGHTWRYGDQSTTGVNARIEGPIMELPAGSMRLSFGAEYTESKHWLGLPQTVRYYDKRVYWLRDTDIDRDVTSFFVEDYVPLIADKPGIQRLALSLSVRRDDYSDFGATTNPRVGLTWDVNDSLSIRGSYGEAFRAPTLTQVNPGVNSTLTRTTVAVADGLDIPVTNPSTGRSDIFSRGGRTPSLGPETAEMWSVGFNYTPVQVEGLALQMTYYTVDYSNRIEALPNWETALSSTDNRRIYEPYVFPYTQPDTCVDGDLDTYNPILTRFLELEGTRFAGGPGDCETVAVIDRGEQNVGSLKQNGIDFQLGYSWETRLGSWNANANVAKILDLDRTLISGGESFGVLDRIGWQTSLRAVARFGWVRNDWSAALTARIEGSYTNDQTPTVDGERLPEQKVGAWTTLDAIVSYTTPPDNGIWSDINATLGVQNLTDKQPPIVLNDDLAIDSNVHNPFGRMWRLELGKRSQ